MAWLQRIDERAAKRFARNLEHIAIDRRDRTQRAAENFAHHAGEFAGRATHQFADAAIDNGALIAAEARHQALRATRAIKADPLPVLIGAVGVALLANLLFARRR